MESKVNYTIVGLFVILLGIGLVAISFWLTEARHQKAYNPYLVFMGESVSGLSEQSSVLFNGVRVGYVKTITLDPENPQRVRLLLMISDETPINASTTATLMSQGITGLTYVGLKAILHEHATQRRLDPERAFPAPPGIKEFAAKDLEALQKNIKAQREASTIERH